jgi:hypothetical protein
MRRRVAASAKPNPSHFALASLASSSATISSRGAFLPTEIMHRRRNCSMFKIARLSPEEGTAQ